MIVYGTVELMSNTGIATCWYYLIEQRSVIGWLLFCLHLVVLALAPGVHMSTHSLGKVQVAATCDDRTAVL